MRGSIAPCFILTHAIFSYSICALGNHVSSFSVLPVSHILPLLSQIFPPQISHWTCHSYSKRGLGEEAATAQFGRTSENELNQQNEHTVFWSPRLTWPRGIEKSIVLHGQLNQKKYYYIKTRSLLIYWLISLYPNLFLISDFDRRILPWLNSNANWKHFHSFIWKCFQFVFWTNTIHEKKCQ